MENFTHYTPTEVAFGRDTELKAGALVKKYGGSRVLLVYGQGSVERSGLLERVGESLKKEGIEYILFGGAKPNPTLEHAQEGIYRAVAEKVDFLLAVGGGSAIDTAKAIAHGAARPECTLWEIWSGKEPMGDSLPVGCVLTIPAAGSEMSSSAVLTYEAMGKKCSTSTDKNRPRFAILNPALAATLPRYQLACGVVDIMMHTMERYFIPGSKSRMTDELAEGLLRTVIEFGADVVADPSDYDAMAEVMWCGSLSHNGMTGHGRGRDFSVHKLGHALSAKYDATHGASLSAVWKAWAEYLYEYDVERFAHYARSVWGVGGETAEEAARAGINATVEYFRQLGAPVNLKELGLENPTDAELMALAMDATQNDTVKLSALSPMNALDVFTIFRKSKG